MGYYESIKRKALKAGKLSWGEWADLIRVWWLLVGFDLALRTLPFPRVRRFAEKVRTVHREEDAWKTIENKQATMHIARRNHLYEMGCLREALALQRTLGREGMKAELKIGVRKEGDQLEAHAWLEYEGEAIGEPGAIADQFLPLATVELK